MTDTARHLLKNTDVSPTLNRVLVLSALMGATHPMNAREILERLSGDTHPNKVTVYRILDLLADKGLVNRISSGERGYRYCARQPKKPHCHFHCLRCNAITCIENDAVTESETALKSLPFHIDNIDLRLDGICPDCQAKNPA